MIKKLLIPALTLTLTACGAGSGKGLDTQGLPIKNEPPSQTNGVTLTSLQQTIFGAICTNCHTGSNAPRGLRLDSEENSYAFLVGHAADEIPDLMRVKPGNPDASYIIRKLEGASGIVGSRMPLGGPYLSQEQINRVRDWIANGAPRSGTGTSPTKVSDIKVEKINNQLTASLHFSRALETDSVSEQNINLSYTPVDSGKSYPIEKFYLLVLDQSLEINVPDIDPNADLLNITLKSPNETPIVDAQLKNINGSDDHNEEGEYHYEQILK